MLANLPVDVLESTNDADVIDLSLFAGLVAQSLLSSLSIFEQEPVALGELEKEFGLALGFGISHYIETYHVCVADKPTEDTEQCTQDSLSTQNLLH